MQRVSDILTFELTKDQKQSCLEIFRDLQSGIPMLRLLEGDVGSGKTIVAISALILALSSHYQAVLMVPTEVLARQHFTRIEKMLDPLGIKVKLLIAAMTKQEKDEVKNDIRKPNNPLIVIGTHSLIQDDVEFSNLGLAVIDEQHRFGVEQRNILKSKGHPHVLMMTATPIPRTMAMAAYGDLDLSIINELPKGRKPVKTRLVPPGKRELADKFVTAHLKAGYQIFVICPLIDESEKLQVKSAIKEADRLSALFAPYQVGLLHGKLKSAEKEQIMNDFTDNRINLLVSTSVVEVGVDIPNATIMVIESAERFGLAQLHQLRGRVGRSDKPSFCLLYTESDQEETIKRLNSLVNSNDGFKLAEIDLELRGPGELIGNKQSGFPDFKMASFGDQVMIYRVRKEAEEILKEDPNLIKHPALKIQLQEVLASRTT